MGDERDSAGHWPLDVVLASDAFHELVRDIGRERLRTFADQGRFWVQGGPRVIGELGALVGADDPRQSLDRVAAGFLEAKTGQKGVPRG